ncbi:Uu.00g056050.m01.CDS01 [Anthostomella pinea]|uniref:Uu.00g056050.m01.CDS01 n=1 Tax=Anthostomella pinea TaxID=933095 RepID=A0AAI8YPT9_9PEZI|nr:Uu.00g056050.m01.CDS01 [Anthostomella pinea]
MLPQPFISATAVKHQEIGLPYLRQSIAESGEGLHESILAAIILMTSIVVITGIPSTWRIHVRGGSEWLQAQRPEWREIYNARILYQLFECIKLIGLLSGAHKARAGSDELPEQHCVSFVLWHFKPLFDALHHMSHMRHASCSLSNCDLETIEARIANAKPDISRLRQPSSVAERLATHHALVFYYACRIQLQRDFRRVPPFQVQELVEMSLRHLEEIHPIERTVHACALKTWTSERGCCVFSTRVTFSASGVSHKPPRSSRRSGTIEIKADSIRQIINKVEALAARGLSACFQEREVYGDVVHRVVKNGGDEAVAVGEALRQRWRRVVREAEIDIFALDAFLDRDNTTTWCEAARSTSTTSRPMSPVRQ